MGRSEVSVLSNLIDNQRCDITQRRAGRGGGKGETISLCIATVEGAGEIKIKLDWRAEGWVGGGGVARINQSILHVDGMPREGKRSAE